MPKRQAEEPLDDLEARHSPFTKKARIDELFEPEPSPDTNGSSPQAKAPLRADAHQSEDDEKAVDDNLESADREEESAYSAASCQSAPLDGYTDLYLDTINRSVLDFDFEKLCSVTLSNINVYACLVCGKYYQGRGPKSHAYFHALEVGHHVFVNMQTKRVYVLPEGYEVTSKSLEDIKFVVDPHLSKDEVSRLDREPKDSLDLAGKKYRPGMGPVP